MKTIAFAIVVSASLFAPGNHDILLGWSLFGLWLAAMFENEPGSKR